MDYRRSEIGKEGTERRVEGRYQCEPAACVLYVLCALLPVAVLYI